MITPGGRLRMMRGVLYRLKRGYGQPVTVVYQTASAAIDVRTGVKGVARAAVPVARAVVLPDVVHKDFKFDIGYLKANSNFTYGGVYTEGQRQVLIDRADLPPDFEIKPSDTQYIVFQGRRYALKAVTVLEVPAYFIVMQETKGAPVNNVIAVALADRLAFTESFLGVIP